MSLEGEQLGHYRLLRQIGRGGMGEVYLVEDLLLGRQDAMKIIRNAGITQLESGNTREATHIFEREAKAIARLDHPNILPLYAYGEEIVHGIPLIYLVMPYCKEGTLADWLRQRGSTALLTPAEAIPLVQQAAAALQHAHEQQIIHQDIKPTNFLIRLRKEQPAHPDLLLADFGIAKISSSISSTSQNVRGTPIYMAPEQWEGQPVPATDQYALAIMLYELLVGRPPFQGGPGQVMYQHCLTQPLSPSALNPRLSLALDSVLLHALSKQPVERYPSMTAFAQAFQKAVQEKGTTTLTVADVLPQPFSEEKQTRTDLPDPLATLEPPVPVSALHENIPITPALTVRKPRIPTSAIGVAPSIHKLPLPSSAFPPLPLLPSRLNTRATVKPTKTAFARRFVLFGLAGLVIIATLVGGIIWLHMPHYNITEFVLPTDGNNLLGIAAGPDGNLWFTESDGNKIGRISPSGVITEFPLPAANNGPQEITAGPDGNLWFTEGYNEFTENSRGKIGRISPDGTITEFPLPITNSYPKGITAGPDGNLWFTEYGSDKIGRITPSGTITEFPLSTLGNGPDGITTGPDGNLWFTENFSGKIGRISPNGAITEFPLPDAEPAYFPDPEEIAAGPNGNLWFTESGGNKIGRISPSGSITEFPLPATNSGPEGITAGPDGNLWFTENSSNGKIGRITPSGSFMELTVQGDPEEIAAGPDGNLWFTESYPDKIGRVSLPTVSPAISLPTVSPAISPTVSPAISPMVSPITEYLIPTHESNPEEITAGPGGTLWFTEYDGNKVGRISPNGSITEFPLPATDSGPEGITAGPDGNLWFTESTRDQIGRITPGGSITEFAFSDLPVGITVGPDGNLWFTEGGNIGRITPSGSITEFALPNPLSAAFSSPEGITVGPDGNLWFTEFGGNKIGRITLSGSITEFTLPTVKSGPTSIAAGPDGNLWFTESTRNRIGRITPSGSITEFATPTTQSGPDGITVGPDGNLWFTESTRDQIGRITPGGSITEFDIPTASGKPEGITAGPDGTLWFTESFGNKIGRFTPSGK